VLILTNRDPRENDLEGFDEVVIATGIDPRRPGIPGSEHRKVVS
jgi:2,4-dienoyl-CoA reductase (NADPH2)